MSQCLYLNSENFISTYGITGKILINATRDGSSFTNDISDTTFSLGIGEYIFRPAINSADFLNTLELKLAFSSSDNTSLTYTGSNPSGDISDGVTQFNSFSLRYNNNSFVKLKVLKEFTSINLILDPVGASVLDVYGNIINNLFNYNNSCGNQEYFESIDLGKGKKGISIPTFGNTEVGANRSLYRKHLAKSFGNLYNPGLQSSPALYNKNVLGPFRTSFNAGDVISNRIRTTDSKYGREANQVGGNNLSRIGGLSLSDGTSQRGDAMYSGNQKFVHDGSDYIRFKKLNAINKNYNDTTDGGENNLRMNTKWNTTTNAAIRRVRR